MTDKKTKENVANDGNKLDAQETIINKYKKQFLYGLVAVIVVVGGYFLYHNYVTLPHEREAEELLYKGQDYFTTDDYEKALNGDGQGYPGFVVIADEYGNTPSGNLAKLYAGLCYAKQDKFQEAVTYIEDFDQCGDQMISPAAMGALGNCYANLDRLDDAVKTLEKAAKLADNNSLSPLFLIQAGEIYESQGKKDDALKCYKQIKDKYVGSMQYADIDKYIERVSR